MVTVHLHDNLGGRKVRSLRLEPGRHAEHMTMDLYVRRAILSHGVP